MRMLKASSKNQVAAASVEELLLLRNKELFAEILVAKCGL